MQTVRREITKEQYEKAKEKQGKDLHDYAANYLHPDFVCWWVYGIYGLWVEEEPTEGKYWLCARIGDCCD